MHTVSRRAALAGLAFFALWPGPAGAQEQTLKIVFPFAAGGSTDAVARMLADHMQKSLGRAVIVENRTGASGRIGLRAVKEAAPDGATLLFIPGSLMTSPSACLSEPRLRSPGRPAADHPSHQIRCGAGRQRQIARPLAARACRLAQGEPGAGDFRLAGRGRGAPFPGGRARPPCKARSAPCPLQGHTGCPSRSDDGPPSHAHHCGGRIHRAPQDRHHPHPGDGGCLALALPAGCPDPAGERLRPRGTELVRHVRPGRHARERCRTPARGDPRRPANAEIRARIETLGFEVAGTTGEELARIQRADYERWGPIIKASGFKADQ